MFVKRCIVKLIYCTCRNKLSLFYYLRLQDGSTLLLGSERLFEHLDMLFAV